MSASQPPVLLREDWSGTRVVELEGPARVSPNDIARAFTTALGHPVSVEIVPRETWRASSARRAARNPTPSIRMIDGFNEGWIDFADQGLAARKGPSPLRPSLPSW